MLIRPNDSTTGSLRIGAAEYPITRDGLRDAFASQLDDQAHLNKGDVYMLAMLVGEELCRHNLKDVDGKTSACEMTLGKLDERTVGAYVREAYIRVNGPYFEDREAISINPDGFIGFAGWADSRNERPFLCAFARWMDEWLYSPDMRGLGREGD